MIVYYHLAMKTLVSMCTSLHHPSFDEMIFTLVYYVWTCLYTCVGMYMCGHVYIICITCGYVYTCLGTGIYICVDVFILECV